MINNLGATKFEPLTKFFDSILDGTADLKTPSKETENSGRVADEL